MPMIPQNEFGEEIWLPPTFQHPRLGEYKDKPEEFFKGVAVRILVDIEVGGSEFLAPVWLDTIRFEDQVVDGVPVRMGVGRVQQRVSGADRALEAGLEVPFHPSEVVDVIERFLPQEGDVPLTMRELP